MPDHINARTPPTDSAEQALYQIAQETGVSIIRWDGESLAAFGDRLIEELADKILEFDGFIDEIRQLDLSEHHESA